MNKTVKPISTFTILAMAFFGMGVGTITPALNAIFVQFSDLPITTLLLVSTLPSLTVIPATLIAGSVAGSKVKYRTLAIIGMTLFVLGGVAPYFATDFTVIYWNEPSLVLVWGSCHHWPIPWSWAFMKVTKLPA